MNLQANHLGNHRGSPQVTRVDILLASRRGSPLASHQYSLLANHLDSHLDYHHVNPLDNHQGFHLINQLAVRLCTLPASHLEVLVAFHLSNQVESLPLNRLIYQLAGLRHLRQCIRPLLLPVSHLSLPQEFLHIGHRVFRQECPQNSRQDVHRVIQLNIPALDLLRGPVTCLRCNHLLCQVTGQLAFLLIPLLRVPVPILQHIHQVPLHENRLVHLHVCLLQYLLRFLVLLLPRNLRFHQLLLRHILLSTKYYVVLQMQ